MGLQLILLTQDKSVLDGVVGDAAAECEVFPIDDQLLGVSIPSRLVDAIGEATIRDRLTRWTHFDLWEGSWRRPL